MNLTKLKELHAKVLAENGQSNNENSVTVAGTEKSNPTSVTAGQQQNMPAITTAGKKTLMIEPDSDDISEYLHAASVCRPVGGLSLQLNYDTLFYYREAHYQQHPSSHICSGA